MPARSARAWRILIPLAAVLLVAAGCSHPSNAPTTYNARTEANYINGCLSVADESLDRTAVVEDQGTKETEDDIVVLPDDPPAGTDTCQCEYDAMSAQVGENNAGEPEYALPFAQFEQLDADLEANLPESASDTSNTTSTTILSQKATDLIASCSSPA